MTERRPGRKDTPLPKVPCYRCNASGRMPCQICGGSGQVARGRDSRGNPQFSRCDGCFGNRFRRCTACNGEGFTT